MPDQPKIIALARSELHDAPDWGQIHEAMVPAYEREGWEVARFVCLPEGDDRHARDAASEALKHELQMSGGTARHIVSQVLGAYFTALGAPRPEGDELVVVAMSREEVQLLRTCIADVYVIEADDVAEPALPTRLWTKLRAALAEPEGSDET